MSNLIERQCVLCSTKNSLKWRKIQPESKEKASQINIELNLEDNLCNSCYTRVIRHDS